MNASSIIFYMIAAFILGTGLLAVTSSRIFRSAVWLLFSLVGVAALYFWMQVPFIGAVQIVVYVGGIVVLILFSIFLTQQSGTQMPPPTASTKFAAIGAAVFGFALCARLIQQYGFRGSGARPFPVKVSDIGSQLLQPTAGGYVLPLEVVSMLLLAAMIGCIVIAMKSSGEKIPDDKAATVTLETVTETIVVAPDINHIPEAQTMEELS